MNLKLLLITALLMLSLAYPVSACYSVSYACKVSCINGDLNTTALSGNVVKSIGNDAEEFADRCGITCAEGVRDASWGSTYNEPLPVDGFQLGGVAINLYAVIPAIIIITLMVVALLYLRKWKP